MQNDGGRLGQARLKRRHIKLTVGGFISQCNPLKTVRVDGGLNGRDEGGAVGMRIACNE